MPGRVLFAVFLSAGLALTSAALATQQERMGPSQGGAEEIRRLIGQLDSKRYKDREEATRKLSAMASVETVLATAGRLLAAS
jgi:hypothetical protein